jgi:hypothetical protein
MKSDRKHAFAFLFSLLVVFAGIGIIYSFSTISSYILWGVAIVIMGIFLEIEDIGQRIRDDIVEELKPKEK